MKMARIKFLYTDYSLIWKSNFVLLMFLALVYPVLEKSINSWEYIIYTFLVAILFFNIFFIFIKDLIYFFKFMRIFTIVFLISINIISAYYLIQVALTSDSRIFKLTILFFMGLFYGTFLWDFFRGFRLVNDLFEVYKKKLFNIVNSNPIQNGVVYLDRADDFTLEFQNRRRNISSFVIGAFFIPFVLLGKGASYFLVLGISQYYSVHAFILASILVPGTLFFIIEMIIPSIALWKLKYPIEKEQ